TGAPRGGRTHLRRLDLPPPGETGPAGSGPRLPLPARQRQLDRGRNLRDLAHHHRRTRPGTAPGTPGRQRPCLEGPAPLSESELNLLYSEIEQELRASVRELLAHRCPRQSVLDRVSHHAPAEVTDRALWQELAELDVLGLFVPETLGGAGATAREASSVAEELGRAVAPVPFLGSAVLATGALVALGTAEEQVRALLTDLAAGQRCATLVVPLPTAPGSGFPSQVRADGSQLTGTVPGVVDALSADVLVVPALGAEGPGLYLLPADQATLSPVVSLDQTRPLAEVTLTGAEATRAAVGQQAVDAVEAALLTGAVLLAAEQLGTAEWAFDTTVAYLKERVQFARPIGSFQALKHRVADLWVLLAQARAVVRHEIGRASCRER